MSRAIFLSLNALGDTLCITPALRAFRKANPGVSVTVVAQAAPGTVPLDLNEIAGGEDAANLARLLDGVRVASGGALATEDGMAAAIVAGVTTVVGSPTLPLLLAAARARRSDDRETIAVSASS